MALTPGTFSYDIYEQWNTGFLADVTFTPTAATSGWRVELTFEGTISSVWNARIVERVGNTYVLENADYNRDLAAGQSVTFGFDAVSTDTTFEFSGGSGGGGEPVTFAVEDASADEGDPAAPGGDGSPSLMGGLSTDGNRIVNAEGEAVTINAVNWFGMETSAQVPHGLWERNWQEMMEEMKALGFNAIRLPFSLEAVLGDPAPNGIDYGLNPDLAGLSSLEVLDKIVAYAEELELGILLDNHRSAAGGGPNGNGLWFDSGYTEADWISAWTQLAERYGDSPAVIGADLVNEPHGAEWSAWAAAAERAGNAVLEVAPEWLIVVEGVGQYQGDPYWWGGNLQGVADRPVQLTADNKLVYSPHDYPASVFAQPWFFDGSNLFEVFRENWGYIHEQGIAPILLGEFGSRLETDVDRRWAEAITTYLSGDTDGDGTADGPPISWAWWSWNPNSGDTGGVLADDWRTPRPEVLATLDPILGEPSTGAEGGVLAFEVTLSAPASAPVTLDYATADGTADAGDDYRAETGTITFAAGETTKTVTVQLLGDRLDEADETVFLDVSGQGPTVRATGVIRDDDGGSTPPPPEPPVLAVSDVTVAEGDGPAVVVLTLSEASEEAVRVDWATEAGSAEAGEDYVAAEGTVTFAPGTTRMELPITLLDDSLFGDNETFNVRLSNPEGVLLPDTTATVTILNDDAAPPPPPPEEEVTVAGRVVNDWSSGAQLAVVLTNTGDTVVEGWELTFDAPAPITQLWGGVLTGTTGSVEVDDAGWNARIAPGQSVEIGFLTSQGSLDAAAWAATDFELV